MATPAKVKAFPARLEIGCAVATRDLAALRSEGRFGKPVFSAVGAKC